VEKILAQRTQWLRSGRGAVRARSAQPFFSSTAYQLRANARDFHRVLCAATASSALKIAAAKLITINNKHWEN
jgi:hypothetical protein